MKTSLRIFSSSIGLLGLLGVIVTACDGADAKDGQDGVDGSVGVQGADGPPGADGEDGAQGGDGAPGLKGAPGIGGAVGPKGEPGAPGVAGVSPPVGLSMAFLGRYSTGVFDEGAAEIVTFDPDTGRVFVVNAMAATVDVLDIDDPTAPELNHRA